MSPLKVFLIPSQLAFWHLSDPVFKDNWSLSKFPPGYGYIFRFPQKKNE